MPQVYRLIVNRLDKHLFIILLAALAFFILKLFIDIVFIKYLIYLFANYITEIKSEDNVTTLYSMLFILVNHLPTLLVYIIFGYLIGIKTPKDRVKETLIIVASITFLFTFLIYEQKVYIESMLLELMSVVYYFVPLISLLIGFNLREKLY